MRIILPALLALMPLCARAEVTLVEQTMESRQEGAGGTDQKSIAAAFAAGAPRYKQCWQERGTVKIPAPGKKSTPRGKGRDRKRKPSAATTAKGGKVLLTITVDAVGRVTAATLKESTLPDKLTEDCILAVTRTLPFPKAEKGSTYEVEYPLNFRDGALF